ncbi:hypothetical protein ABEB36_005793 [Hypothenemus hampei]|uniref:Invasin domain-containing protein n=1 Tax=Hypothenemus hampei TaxID=57062 RepID=A0ABD1EZF3_HYPHA
MKKVNKPVFMFFKIYSLLLMGLAWPGRSLALNVYYVTANDRTFFVDGGFPETAFKNATFTIHFSGGFESALGYTWSSNVDWVSVNQSGVVTFGDIPSEDIKPIIITATPEPEERPILYEFRLKHWFVYTGKKYSISDAESYCDSIGLSLPPYKTITNAELDKPGHRDIGTLWSEWGYMKFFGWNIDDMYWTNDTDSEGYHYLTLLEYGSLHSGTYAQDVGTRYVMCSNEIPSDVITVTAHGHIFYVESGFPTTGFKGANFKINIHKDKNFTFSSNQNWLGVNSDGIVTITAQPNAGNTDALITITSESDDEVLSYSFNLDYWFVNAGKQRYSIAEAEKYCADIGLSLPPYKIVTNADNVKQTGYRDLGTLWSEWGNLDFFGWGNYVSYWTNDTGPEGYHYIVDVVNGYLFNEAISGFDSNSLFITCSNKLQPASDVINVIAN